MKAPYITTKRPPTEPYEIWKERRRRQQKEMRRYLKGTIIWVSAELINEGTDLKPKWVKKIVNGTYCVNPN